MDFRSFWRRRDIRLFALALPLASLGLFWIVPLAGLLIGGLAYIHAVISGR